MNDARIRPARPDEATLLSRLAMSSKAYWGYNDVFLAACREELTVGGEDIERHAVAVVEEGGSVRGFYLLREGDGAGAEEPAPHGIVEYLYVDPAAIGAGHGGRLWRHMVAAARAHGYVRVVIHSDPHAEGFYRAMGARRVGEVASGSIEGRRLPLMRFELEKEDGSL